MKFIGLILICAASSMALLLPAMGVVKFPVLDHSTWQEIVASASNPNGTPDNSTGNTDPQASAGLLVAAQVSGLDSTTTSNPIPAGSLQTAHPTASNLLGKIPFTQVPSQRVGLGVWLLLLPAMLIGLGMWTFGSSPKSSK